VTLAEVNASDELNAFIGFAQFGLLVLTAILFIRWFRRAYRNVEPLGGERRFKTGWAIGGWFVPFLNLWRPEQIANDIWHRASRAGTIPSPRCSRSGGGCSSHPRGRASWAVLAILVIRRLTARQEDSARRRDAAPTAAGP
jgi:hypothetical protein